MTTTPAAAVAPGTAPRPSRLHRPTAAGAERRPPHRGAPTLTFDADRPARHVVERPAPSHTSLLGLRLVSGLVDVALLVGVNLAVIYFTLRLAGLPMGLAAQLPGWPLLVFLALFDFGYFSILTAFGGQTIGKMATGLRVESSRGARVTVGEALTRTAAYGVSVVPAGLGLLGVFFRGKRPLHDLLANTRVVKI